jgi:hypothetical protein
LMPRKSLLRLFDSHDAEFLRNILCARRALEFSHGLDPNRKSSRL